MNVTSLKNQDRISDLRDLMQRVSAMHEPEEVQREFGQRLARFSHIDGYVAASQRRLSRGHYKITRFITSADQFAGNQQYNAWQRWDDLPAHTGGFLGDLMADPEPEPRLFNDFFLRNDPVLGDALEQFGSAVVLPLFDQGEAINWGVMLRRAPGAFSEADLEEFFMRGNLIGRATRTLVMQKEVTRLNGELRQQLDEVASIQQSLLPQRLPKIPRLGLAASYLTSLVAGGDYYDFFPHEDGSWSMCIADVSGHGPGAATMVAMMHGILHSHPDIHYGPAATLRRLNELLALNTGDANFVTALFGRWRPDDRSLTLASAGHHPPSHKRHGGEILQIDAPADLPLGVLPDVEYEQATTTLDPGDTLLLYTDGVTEAFSPPPEREMFGVKGLHAALDHCSGMPQCVIDSIHERLFDHTRSRDRDDDQTLLAMRVDDES